jgi:hypothetical protein
MLSLSIRVPLTCSRRYILHHPSSASRCARSESELMLVASLLLGALTLVCASETPGCAQGIAGRKTEIVVKTSPNVYLPGPALRVDVASLKPVTQRVPELLQQKIQDSLIKNEPRLALATGSPDTLITCTITDLRYSTGVEARTRQVYQKIGETTMTDPNTGVATTMDQFGMVDVPYSALAFNARMSVKCDVRDVATGIVLYVDSFDPVYSDARDVVTGPRTDDLNDVYVKLAADAAGLILAQLSSRVYTEVVDLPSGRLKEASKLAEANMWNEALTLLVATPPFKNQSDDAYRLYSIGLAHEALAYAAPNAAERRRHLEQALDNYRRATELKPQEDAFWGPKNRAELLFWQATRLAAQVEAFDEAKRAGSISAATWKLDIFNQAKNKIRPVQAALTNDDVVRMVKSGRPGDYIAANIRHAPETRFDLSSGEVLKLRREGVRGNVLKAMKDARRGPDYSLRIKKHAFFYAAFIVLCVPLMVAAAAAR